MIEGILEERGSRYGTFLEHAKICQGLQAVLTQTPNWSKMPVDTRQAFMVICDKMARACNGDPEYEDNFIDIIGYATLPLNRIREGKKIKETPLPAPELELTSEMELVYTEPEQIFNYKVNQLEDGPNYLLADE